MKSLFLVLALALTVAACSGGSGGGSSSSGGQSDNFELTGAIEQ
jgi:ABC-type glycerol-3-phosphate transport system substrate-binding protein